jgi:hypothetical protein
MTAKPIETVTIGGLRYIVATLRDDDLKYLAKRTAREMRLLQAEADTAALELEHRRFVPSEEIEHPQRGDVPHVKVRMVHGEWTVVE